MGLPSYEPVWPETVMLWGAGATARLGMPMTKQQEECLTQLARRGRDLDSRVREAFDFDKAQEKDKEPEHIADMLVILGDQDGGGATAALESQFPKLSPSNRNRRKADLRRVYDWPTLRRVILACPRRVQDVGCLDAAPISLMDLFNLLDLHIQAGSGFHAPSLDDEHNVGFISPDALIAARRALQLLITLQFVVAYRKVLREPNHLRPYLDFAKTLARLMREEGQMFADRGWCMQSRGYSLFGYAVFSLNWDPMLLWLIFKAHYHANKRDPNPLRVGSPSRPQKLFNDLGYLVALREVEGDELDVWYTMNESVVQRLNDPNHKGDRYIRFGKYYFPHGTFNFRECPNCGKLNAYLGEWEAPSKCWQAPSKSLFPPLPFPRWSKNWAKSRSKGEKAWREEGEADALQCVYCGAKMGLEHIHLVMQTSFKTAPPPYLEEQQRELRVALENARHILFMGYSLPRDDVVYRSLLAARLARRRTEERGRRTPLTISLIGFEDNAPEEWLEDEAIDKTLRKDGDLRRIYRDLSGIVGQSDRDRPRFRAYGGGIPEVFSPDGTGVDDRHVRELMFPDDLWRDRRTKPPQRRLP